jgi:hypothetical protein
MARLLIFASNGRAALIMAGEQSNLAALRLVNAKATPRAVCSRKRCVWHATYYESVAYLNHRHRLVCDAD